MTLSRQRGAALLTLLAVLAIGGSWFLVSRISGTRSDFRAAERERNAVVLKRAKQALIGYVAAQAAKALEDNPGAFPCPEAPGSFNAVNGTDGKAQTPSCTLPMVGRFPWRTIGTDKLVDSTGEPLWYVVSPGWAKPGALTNTNINSNSVGQLTVDGAANDSVALIIAPGPAFNVLATAGCTAWNQVRPATGTPDWRNYLECENATNPADTTFVTTGPSGSFNDQVVRITVVDVMPAIEAAIANRIEREIAPALVSVYASPSWGISGGKSVHAYAAPFANPGPGTGTSNFRGVINTTQGLLPFNQTQGCAADPANPRCLPSLIIFPTPASAYIPGPYGYIQTQNCNWATADIRECDGEYHEDNAQPSQPIRLEMTATFNNVALGLRAIDTTKMTVEARDNGTVTWLPQPVTYTATMNTNGSVTLTFGATLPNIDTMGWGSYAEFRLRLDRAVMGDHALLSSTDPTMGWFVRNEWYRLLYYATVAGHTAAALPAAPSCTTGGTCLSVANIAPAGAQRAVLILAGRSINGSARPSAVLADYLEFGNHTGNFERQTITAAAPAGNVDTGIANAYLISAAAVPVGRGLQFKAANTNTGASTLNSPATGAKAIRNPDSSALAASQIQANATVEVFYDGAQFTLSKRPFNDRIVVVDTN